MSEGCASPRPPGRARPHLRPDYGALTWPDPRLAKQVGDLAKAILTTEGYYLGDRDGQPGYRAGTDRVANELADILYCLMRVADHYQIDLAEAHVRARTAEWDYVSPDAPIPWAD